MKLYRFARGPIWDDIPFFYMYSDGVGEPACPSRLAIPLHSRDSFCSFPDVSPAMPQDLKIFSSLVTLLFTGK